MRREEIESLIAPAIERVVAQALGPLVLEVANKVRIATLKEAAAVCDQTALEKADPDNRRPESPRAAYQSGAAKCAWRIRKMLDGGGA